MARRKPNKKKSRKQSSSIPAQRFRVHPKAFDVLNQLGYETLGTDLRKTLETAATLAGPLEDCRLFTLLEKEHFDALAHEGVRFKWFWSQVSQLLILACRSACRAVSNIVDGLSWAVGTRNELMLAYSGRALIEHAASVHAVAVSIERIKQKLIDEVWPDLQRGSGLPVSEQDTAVHEELVRFVLGKVVDTDVEVPQIEGTRPEWEDFKNAIHDIPDRYKSRRVGKLINDLCDQADCHHLRALYKLLSEFCHPNSASRNLDFAENISGAGIRRMSQTRSVEFGIGFVRILNLVSRAVPKCSEVLVESLSELDACRKPMPDELPGERNEALHSQPIVDEFGRSGWATPGQVAWLPIPTVELSAAQKNRIKAIHDVFYEVEGMPLEESEKLFASEGPHAENEIQLWEHFVKVFTAELSDREPRTFDKRMLFCAMVNCVPFSSTREFLLSFPAFDGLPDLDRVIRPVQSRSG